MTFLIKTMHVDHHDHDHVYSLHQRLVVPSNFSMSSRTLPGMSVAQSVNAMFLIHSLYLLNVSFGRFEIQDSLWFPSWPFVMFRMDNLNTNVYPLPLRTKPVVVRIDSAVIVVRHIVFHTNLRLNQQHLFSQ